MMGPKNIISSVLPVLLVSACVYPTERSDQLAVEMAPLPVYRQGEIDTLFAQAVTPEGEVLPDVEIRFQSSNSSALAITQAGALVAAGPGISVVTARAVGYQNATVAEQLVTVKAPVAVDSIRPGFTRYGETVQFHGVGLHPDSLVFVEVGGLEAPPFYNWTPVDPNKPNGLGVLDVWVGAPTPPRAGVRVVSLSGGAVPEDSLRVNRRDIYEPNDSVPSELGSLPTLFFNPALAFEQRIREEIGADWYRFDQTSVGNRTVIVSSLQISTQAYRAYVTQPGVFSRSVEEDIAVTGSGWALGGPGVQVCGGVPFTFDVLAGGGMIAAFADVPVGSYEILVPYGSVALTGYRMLISNTYSSELPPDRDEENDVCSLAKPLTAGESRQLTIDNPYDTDWYSYSPPSDVVAVFSTAITSNDSTGVSIPELDIFVFQQSAGGIVPVAESNAAGDRTDVASITLQANQNYLILVTDYAGAATRYSLTLTTTPATAASASNVQTPLSRIRLGLEMPMVGATEAPPSSPVFDVSRMVPGVRPR